MKTVREITEAHVYEIFDRFANLVYEHGEDTEFYGIKVLAEKEGFVKGTLFNSTALLYVHYVKCGDERAEHVGRMLNRFLRLVTSSVCKTWGKLSTLRGLVALYDAGLLSVIDEELLSLAKTSTDYSDFFDKENIKIINLPSNYIQVALACAAFREKLGFESDEYSSRICEVMSSVMGESLDGWMDEAPPYKRFDRYSFIVSSELSDNFELAGLEFKALFENNLRLAAKHSLFMANKQGDGWNYGRSLSCHGDCAIAEVLSSALSRGLVEDKDKPLALAYIGAITDKTVNYWYDKSRKSYNIWWDGRSTNGYRQVARVMQVNLDMGIHLLSTLNNLEVAGLADTIPDTTLIPSPDSWCYDRIKFASGEYVSEAVVLRYGDILSMLPLVGLGSHIHNSAYMPYPAICRSVESAPEGQMPFLIPEYVKDGVHLRPTQYFKSVEIKEDCGKVLVSASGNLAVSDGKFPTDSGIPFSIKYTFFGKEITCEFSTEGELDSATLIAGTHGDGTSIEVFGFDTSRLVFTAPNPEDYSHFIVYNCTDEERSAYKYMTPHGFVTEAYEYTVKNPSTVSYKINLI